MARKLAGEEPTRKLSKHSGAVAAFAVGGDRAAVAQIGDRLDGPVAGFGVTAAGPAVAQIFQDLYAVADDGMRCLAFDVGNKADPAGIVLKARVIQPAGSREKRGMLFCHLPTWNRRDKKSRRASGASTSATRISRG